MPTTTRTIRLEDLIKQAEFHEERARAIRLTIAVVFTDPIQAKKIPQTTALIQAATALRQSQRTAAERHAERHAERNGHGELPPQVDNLLAGVRVARRLDREAQTRALLAEGPQSTVALAHAVDLSKAGVTNWMKVHARPWAELVGNGTAARWQLRDAPSTESSPTTPPKKEQRRSRSKSKSSPDKLATVLQILTDAGGWLTSRDLAERAHAAGVPGLTGIHNYVKNGYLQQKGSRKKNGKGKGAISYRLGPHPPPTTPVSLDSLPT